MKKYQNQDVKSVLWDKQNSFDDNHNIYMKDENITPRDEDGGCNHFELRNHDRAYTLRRDNGSIIFRKGDKNPAMERAGNWIVTDL